MEKYEFFVKDLVVLLKEKFEQSKEAKNQNDFDRGMRMGYYDVLDLIKSEAKAFQIPLNDLDLESYNLEKYL